MRRVLYRKDGVLEEDVRTVSIVGRRDEGTSRVSGETTGSGVI